MIPAQDRLLPRRAFAAAVLSTGAVLLSGCSSTATVEAAPEAHDPKCAEVMLALPEEIGGHSQRETTSQGTSAWGEPSAVVVRCGVEPPGPSPELCVGVEGVDWLTVEGEDHWQLVSYGREPAVEVLVDIEAVSSSTAMLAASSAVRPLEQTRQCTEREQSIESDDDAVEVTEGSEDQS